ncbi:MAG: type IV secretion system protein [Proteobacteria bacterium]|nr:type IV secretion system protein [Pseudomonadota bacterium]
MGLFDLFAKARGQQTATDSGGTDAMGAIKNWYADRYENALIQRNILFLVLLVSLATIGMAVTALRYIKNTKSIEPFVIEIEPKTGVTTVVDPVTSSVYSANDAVRRHFVWQYIKAREEYYSSSYNYNYNQVVRVFSSSDVYYGQYRAAYGQSNPTAPVNLLGQSGYREVALKSMIFPNDRTAQVRFTITSAGMQNAGGTQDKIAFLQFEFANLKMNNEERLINPLGFRVNLYRLEDEKVK